MQENSNEQIWVKWKYPEDIFASSGYLQFGCVCLSYDYGLASDNVHARCQAVGALQVWNLAA